MAHFGALVGYNPDPMKTHLYLFVTCKQVGCSKASAVAYLGRHFGDGSLEYLAPDSFDHRCKACRSIHRYRRDDLFSNLLEDAPGPEFRAEF